MPRGQMHQRRRSPTRWPGPTWGTIALPIRDGVDTARVLTDVLALHYPVRWDPHKQRLRTDPWESSHHARREARELARRGHPEALTHAGDFKAKSIVLREIANAWGLSQTTLYRLTHGAAATMPLAALWRIKRRLTSGYGAHGKRLCRRFERAALSPQVQRVLREYESYVVGEQRRLRAKRSAEHDFHIAPGQETSERDRFSKAAQKLGASRARLLVAILRVYDPIVAWPGLRRALAPDERLRIVKTGYRREHALLKLEMRYLREQFRNAGQGNEARQPPAFAKPGEKPGKTAKKTAVKTAR